MSVIVSLSYFSDSTRFYVLPIGAELPELGLLAAAVRGLTRLAELGSLPADD